MDIKMKLRDFVVNTDGACILNCEEGDRCSKILTKDMEIKSTTPSGLSISLVDKKEDQMICVYLPNGVILPIYAEECPIAEFLGERKVLYKRINMKKWNETLSPGHFYLTFDDDEQIGNVVFLVRLEDNFLEWEEFSQVMNYNSYYTNHRTVERSMDSLTNSKFIPLYGIGLKTGLKSIGLI